MPFTSSQGINLIAGATKISMKASRRNPEKLDASTLDLAHGSERVSENALPDPGPYANDGITYTVTASGFGEKPALASTVEAFGTTCYCTESTDEASVGELAAWSASYTSDYDTECVEA